MSDNERNCPYQADKYNLTHLHYKQSDGSELVLSVHQVMPDGTQGQDLELMACTLVQMLLPTQAAVVEGRPVLVSPFTYWVKSTIEYYGIDMLAAADREEAFSMGVEF